MYFCSNLVGTLDPGWKPELAKRVKQQLLRDGPEKLDAAVLCQWQKLFEALHNTRARTDAAQHLESLSEQSHPAGTPDRPRPRIHVVIRASDSTCAIPRSAGTRASVPTSAAAPCTAERKSRTVGGAQIAYCRLMTTRVTPSEGGAKDTRPACTATKISQAIPSFDSLTTVSRCWCGGNGFELPAI